MGIPKEKFGGGLTEWVNGEHPEVLLGLARGTAEHAFSVGAQVTDVDQDGFDLKCTGDDGKMTMVRHFDAAAVHPAHLLTQTSLERIGDLMRASTACPIKDLPRMRPRICKNSAPHPHDKRYSDEIPATDPPHRDVSGSPG